MVCSIVIGATGTGKSDFIKDNFCKDERLMVYDYQSHDYKELDIYDAKLDQKRFRIRGRDMDIETFFDVYNERIKYRGFTAIVEEATGLFSSSKDKEFTKLLLSKRHVKTNWVLCFHSVQDVPRSVLRFADWIILKKTMDIDSDVKLKLKDVGVKAFARVKNEIRRTVIYGCSNLTDGMYKETYYEGELAIEKFQKKRV